MAAEEGSKRAANQPPATVVEEETVFDFAPDLVIYAATSSELQQMFKSVQLQHLARHDLLDQFPYVVEAMNEAGVGTGVGTGVGHCPIVSGRRHGAVARFEE